MAIFPKVQSPCPVKNSLAEYMDGDICRLCERQVFDLNAMSDAERQAFMASCTGEVCVSYKIPLRGMAAALALSAAAVSMPAAAQDALVELDGNAAEHQNLEKCLDEHEIIEWVTVGGIKDTTDVEYIDTEEDLETPELPVTYEEVAGETSVSGIEFDEAVDPLDAPQLTAVLKSE